MARADLSVIITNYNKPTNQLIDCFDSIKNQTVLPKEIILVDDHSDKPHILPEAISIMLPENMGVATARNMGVRMSTGRLLLFVDGDDMLSPDFIQQCGRVIDKKKDVAYPNMILFDKKGETNHLTDSPSKIKPEYVLGRNCSIPVTSMMWRTMYDDLGGFRDYPVFEDWDFWIRAMFKGYTFGRANTLLMYRQNHNSRNCASREIKNEVHSKITAPYEIKDGKIVEKESDGTKAPKTS